MIVESRVKEKKIIYLRQIEISDIDFMIQLVSDSLVTRYLPGVITNRNMMLDWISGLKEYDHECIVYLNDGTVIGECSLTDNGDFAEIGLMLLPEYWNKGYGTETVSLLFQKAKEKQIREVIAITDSGNYAAIRVMEKNGFQLRNVGWMTWLSEEGEELSSGQNVVEYRKGIL